jgi:hypothetical protein
MRQMQREPARVSLGRRVVAIFVVAHNECAVHLVQLQNTGP